jgi:hypothetical protein
MDVGERKELPAGIQVFQDLFQQDLLKARLEQGPGQP